MAQPITNLRKHVCLPVPNPEQLPKESLSKSEILTGILSNLEKSHQTVRNNILQEAKSKAETEFSTTTILPPDDIPQTNKAASTAKLFTNLSAPPPSQDPSLPTSNTSPSFLLPPPPPTIIQATPPSEISLAIQTTEILDFYDQSARKARHYYQAALDRFENPRGDPPTTGQSRRRSSGSSVHAAASPADRRGGSANASPWGGGGTGTGSANASPRDPRVTRPSR